MTSIAARESSLFVALAKGVLAELDVKPDGRNPEGPPLLIVGRIRDVLEIEAGEESGE